MCGVLPGGGDAQAVGAGRRRRGLDVAGATGGASESATLPSARPGHGGNGDRGGADARRVCAHSTSLCRLSHPLSLSSSLLIFYILLK